MARESWAALYILFSSFLVTMIHFSSPLWTLSASLFWNLLFINNFCNGLDYSCLPNMVWSFILLCGQIRKAPSARNLVHLFRRGLSYEILSCLFDITRNRERCPLVAGTCVHWTQCQVLKVLNWDASTGIFSLYVISCANKCLKAELSRLSLIKMGLGAY